MQQRIPGLVDIPWEDVHLFLAIAETGSFSAAARRLRTGQPTVSRRLADLEYRLGYKLFNRQAAGATLTSAAERLVEPARKMAEWAGEVARAASKGEKSPRGVVRITAPPGVSFDFVAPFAAYAKEKYPLLRIEILSSINYLDLVRGEADLALRTRAPVQKDLIAVATLEHENAVFVTKTLAGKLPKKPTPADIPWVAWAPPYEQLPPNPQLEALIPNFEPAFTSDNFLVLLRAAEMGLGAMILGRVKHKFSQPSPLIPLDFELGPHSKSSLHLVAAKSALDIPRVRAIADLLAKELGKTVRK